MIAEYFRYGGKTLRERVYEVVLDMWTNAAEAEDGHEADLWPDEWKLGLVVPLWKKKGNRKDRNTGEG